MIKLLLVEDEPPIGRAIKKMIEQISQEFLVVGCEYNGEAALERLGREHVDVVLTDIRMPVMDGIKLLEVMRERYPDCIVAILSGYQEFSYAQSALRNGAFDYLLKPVSREKLAEFLGRLEDVCSVNELNRKRELVMESMSGVAAPNPRASSKCSIFLTCVGAWPLIPDDTMTPGAAFWRDVSADDFCRRLLTGDETVLTFEGKVKPERVFVLENVSPQRLPQLAQELFDRLAELANPIPVTICAFPELAAIWEVGTIIRALRAQLYTGIRLCGGQLCWDTGDAKKPAPVFARGSAESVVEALVTKNAELLKKNLAEVVGDAVRSGMTQIEFCRLLDAVICDQRLQNFSMADVKLDLYEAVSNAVALQSLADDLFAIFDHFNATEFKSEQRELIDQIKRYLELNFDKNITNEMLSQQFGFVPSYISKIFRRHKGVSPSEYMTRLRMEKAKAAIINNPDLLIRNVAQLVGYNDPYYFSKAFKKETGKWPTQFQQKQ